MQRFAQKAFAGLLALSLLAALSGMTQYEQELGAIKHEWTRILLEVPEPEQAPALHQLMQRAQSLADRHPSRDEARRWEVTLRRAWLRQVYTQS